MAEGITEIWHITWFCMTLVNPQCAALHDKVYAWSAEGEPIKYFSERQCVDFAEAHAEAWWNERRITMEYACNKARTYEPFVAHRRYTEKPVKKWPPECGAEDECEYARARRRR